LLGNEYAHVENPIVQRNITAPSELITHLSNAAMAGLRAGPSAKAGWPSQISLSMRPKLCF